MPVVPRPNHIAPAKSIAMRMIEKDLRRPLEEVLLEFKTASEAAKVIGVDVSTISRWRQRLGLPPLFNGPGRPRPKGQR